MTSTSYLDSLQRFGIHLGLERIAALLATLDNPQGRFAAIHVAGTNGKGSVCAYLSHILQGAGYRTGRYTSPHLVHWHERIWIDGRTIDDRHLAACLDRVRTAATSLDPGLGAITQFEAFTAAAFLAFADAGIQLGVIEVGLGGRLDATNVFAQPLVTAITSIGLDHTDRLGDTLAAIAGEKAGILRPGVPLVVGPLPPEARRVIAERSALLGVPVRMALPAHRQGADEAEWEGIRYHLPLAGEMQLANSAVALAVCRELTTRGWPLSDQHLASGIAASRWPGRCQWLEPDLLIDGAHNLDGILHLRRYLDRVRPNTPVRWIVGIMASKDAPAMLTALLRPGDRCTAVPVPEAESWPPAALAAIAHQCGVEATTAADFQEALHTRPPGLCVLCGSLYLVGAVLQAQE